MKTHDVSDAPPALKLWPQNASPLKSDPETEARIEELLDAMSLEQKVGQIIQADVNSISPEQVREYHIGSILNGGNSGPGGDDRAPAPVWLEWADKYYDASMTRDDTAVNIPVIWGGDAVHGNANIIGATIFPHNIGLGAARDPGLLRRIGEVTAKELRVVGGDWTFAPTIAVVRDDRWGRTYEGYSETPEIVAEYAKAIVEGIQGVPGDEDFLRSPHVIATAKHFIGDGGTLEGKDQGETPASEEEIRDLFAPGYYAAVKAGVQSVMASYNSWQGQKMHGHKYMLTDVLVGRIGFDGFVVGDWNGHGQIEGCTTTRCSQSLLAGLDMYMAPDSWRDLYENTLEQARSGEISIERLDEAVARILRVKLRAGVFEAGRPSERAFAGDFEILGAPEHRAIAREAVRKSLVLLKNDGGVLPIRRDARILVAGDGADDLQKQTGGWTISWQGLGNSRTDFPHAETIFEAVREQVAAAGGAVELSPNGDFSERPDVAIVVFGENPYAEFQGDRPHLDYQSEGDHDLEILKSLKSEGVPVVSVFLSGRPMYVTPELNQSDAFIAAWLPGAEGGGVADVLLRTEDGAINYDFTGRLSYSWPRSPTQTPLNIGDEEYDPLFAYDFGLTYAAPRETGRLEEADPTGLPGAASDVFFASGRATLPWTLTSAGAATTKPIDRNAQEDALSLSWNGEGSLLISGAEVDLSRQANGDMSISFDFQRETVLIGAVELGMACAADPSCSTSFDITSTLNAAPEGDWNMFSARLSCFGEKGVDLARITSIFELTVNGDGGLNISDVRLTQANEAMTACPA